MRGKPISGTIQRQTLLRKLLGGIKQGKCGAGFATGSDCNGLRELCNVVWRATKRPPRRSVERRGGPVCLALAGNNTLGVCVNRPLILPEAAFRDACE